MKSTRWFIGRVFIYLPLAVVSFAWLASFFGGEAIHVRTSPQTKKFGSIRYEEYHVLSLASTRQGLSASYERDTVSLPYNPLPSRFWFDFAHTREEDLLSWSTTASYLGFKWRVGANAYKPFVILPFWFLLSLTTLPVVVMHIRQRPNRKRGFDVLSQEKNAV